MSVDFSQFEDGDTIRVTLEGKWSTRGFLQMKNGARYYADSGSVLPGAKSAELVEREVKPFHEGDVVLIHDQPRRRDADGKWRTSYGGCGSFSDQMTRERIRDGMYRPVVLYGKPVEKVEVRSG